MRRCPKPKPGCTFRGRSVRTELPVDRPWSNRTSPRGATTPAAPRAGAQAACGSATTYAVDSEGRLWAWGRNSADISTTSADGLRPELVRGLEGVRVAAVAAGSAHVLALVANGGGGGPGEAAAPR